MSSTDEISQEMAEKTKQAALAVSREIFKSLMKISMEQQMNAQQQQAELERMKSRLDEFVTTTAGTEKGTTPTRQGEETARGKRIPNEKTATKYKDS